MRVTLLALLLVVAAGQGVLAHHGWRWTEGQNVELIGVIREVKLGNPHGEITVEADGETWVVEVGQPWRNERAGLRDNMFKPGVTMTSIGEKSADPSQKVLKAERIIIDGTTYELYPDRD